jgi:hypothetical protein
MRRTVDYQVFKWIIGLGGRPGKAVRCHLSSNTISDAKKWIKDAQQGASSGPV